MGKTVTEDTIITEYGKSIPVGAYEKYFKEALGNELFLGFHAWLGDQAGKTVKEALVSYDDTSQTKPMEQILSEERFNIISKADKAFIVDFDKMLGELGYDYGGGYIGGAVAGWEKYGMIAYGKTSVKSRPCLARVYANQNGEIYFRFYLTKVDKHMQYIESTPAHIKNAFKFEGGDCQSCNTACAPGKVYTIDGQLMRKCNHSTFFFYAPSVDKFFDYKNLLMRFFPKKKTVGAKK